ncbi:restriction endonuclease subunit S [Staphylococcus argenteus]|uniref:restriction endonuclease subunit S n=1 Tax=Staphylococcus argenteus TaxID=985002 RepID=UPI0006474658|nr:restriction endonuclease subunit S [Staphylococcus argenteus]
MSNTGKMNVPELRFPEFEGEWEEKELGEIFQIISGSTPLKSNKEFYENGNINWVKTTDLNNSKVTHSKEKITEYAMKSLKLKLVPKNSVLIAMYGGFNQIGRTGLLKIDATINQAISALLMNHETNPEFIQAYLNYQVKGWKRYAASSRKDPNITKKDIEQFKVPYVSINEQQKIGEFFSKIDDQIELEEQKLELLQQQKKGYMQKIFSQELRFKDENGDDYPEWEEKKMGEITTMFSGGTPQSTNTRYYKGDIPFIRSGEISKTYTEMKINEEALNNSSAKLVEVGDLLYALYGATSGEVAISKINGAINQAVLCIRTNESIEFLLNYLFFSKNKILNTFIQGGQGNLSANIVKNLIIEIPTIIEQRKIGDFFCNIDNLIEIQERKLEFLKQRKQSLLQKMFV